MTIEIIGATYLAWRIVWDSYHWFSLRRHYENDIKVVRGNFENAQREAKELRVDRDLWRTNALAMSIDKKPPTHKGESE